MRMMFVIVDSTHRTSLWDIFLLRYCCVNKGVPYTLLII